jgi:hypothetical protein
VNENDKKLLVLGKDIVLIIAFVTLFETREVWIGKTWIIHIVEILMGG